MAYPQERRTQVFTGPRFDNRPFRKGTVQGFSQKQNLNPMLRGADAASVLEDQMGMKADSQGNWGSVRDYGRDMMLASQQRNSLSRGTPGGYASGLANPLNSNLTPRGFSQQLQQRNQGMTREQNIAQAQQAGTFGSIRDKYNLEAKRFGKQMDESGNITALFPYRPDFSGTTTQAQTENASKLKDRAAGLKLLREMSQTPLQKGILPASGGATVEGQYGAGYNVPYPKGEKRSAGYEGDVNGRPFSEVMQGLATKQVREGTWREGDALPYEGQNDALNPNATRRSVKDVTEENRQKILSRQRLAAKNR